MHISLLLTTGLVLALMNTVPAFDRNSLTAELKPLRIDTVTVYPEAVRAYFTCYSLDPVAPVKHFFGTVESAPYTLAVHVFTVPDPRATIIMTHGLFDNVGILKNLICMCLDKKYNVAAFDLPGHGVSSGARVAIDSFVQYGQAVGSVFISIKDKLPGPYIFMAHSTGCAAGIEYFHGNHQEKFDHAVFISPLVKGSYYVLSKAGYIIASPFLKKTMRLYRYQSSDREFLRALRKDPLGIRDFPLRWARAYYEWFDRVQSYAAFDKPDLHVIQGSRDDVVDWRYNIPFLKRTFKKCKVTFIEGARHQVMNEAGAYREQFEKKFGEILESL